MFILLNMNNYRIIVYFVPLAQWIERSAPNRKVMGSIPVWYIIKNYFMEFFMNCFIFSAEENDENLRLDIFLSEKLEDLSRSMLQRLISDGNINVNGKSVNKNYKLKPKDIIEVNVPKPKALDIMPSDIPLDILYEDNEIIVINKPQNMVVHPAAGHYDDTLVNALLFHCGDKLSGINGIMRPGIVHRIDRDTSGILVVAKTDNAHKHLALQLEEHSMTRVYNAIVYNNFKEDDGIVDKPIGRSPNDRKKMAVVEKNSKNAVTHYKVIERMGRFNLIELKLETGRTHQIRVHMAYIGHPLLGDIVYGPKKQPFNLQGQVLHARILGFIHPATKKYMEFKTPLPEYFQKLIDKLKTH